MTPEEASANFLAFNKRLDLITLNTSDEDKRRIHYNSLRNFIYHYNSFNKGRIKVTELLEEYITLIESQNYSFTVEQSQAVYDMYVGPIGHNYYRRYLNFSTAFALFVEVLLFGIPFYGCWLLFHSNNVNITLLIIYIIYLVNYISKYYRRKIFGYRY